MRLWQPHQPVAKDPPRPVTRGAIRFATLGGGAAWLSHLILAYVIAEFGCLSGLGQVQRAGLSVVTWMLIAMTALTLGVAVLATVVAWRNRHRLLRARSERSESHEAEDFTSRFGLINNVMFTLIIAVQSVPILYFLREC